MTQLRTFGGCKRLVADYRAIGVGLLRFEHACAAILVGANSNKALRELQTDVANVSTETLETYLDDLTDTAISLEELYLLRGRINLLSPTGIVLVSLAVLGLVGLLTVATDFPLATATAASPLLLIAALFAVSRHHSVRRLRFAHVLRIVIAERRGAGRGVPVKRNARIAPIGAAAA
jgi:hypothetical protein